MALNFKFPDVGEGIHEGKLVKWRVKEGEEIKVDAVIAEVETDKAVVEIPSPRAGVILKTYFKEGDAIKVGQTLITIGEKGEPIPVDEVKQAPQIANVQKSMPAEKAPSQTAPKIAAPIQSQAPAPSGIIATPAVRQKAKEMGVDLSKVAGTGPAGRVLQEDVENAAKSGSAKIGQAQGGSGQGTAQGAGGQTGGSAQMQSGNEAQKQAPSFDADFSQFGQVEKVAIAGIRKRIAETMSRSKRTAAHVTHFDEADVTLLAKLREELKPEAEKKGIKLTYLAYVVKAAVIALKTHPKFNASFDESKDEIVLKKYYHIGIAVDTAEGLIVPVIRDADKKGIYEIAAEIMRLAKKANERKMKLDDLKGGSFTITNIGSIGGEFFTPIIYHPEVAILGLGRIGDKVVVEEGKAVIAKKLPLSLSFDHRIIDGAEAARFVNDVIKMLENPETIK
ncbi:MAG: dihydrolipoamide acetyltransferase family protein [Candidatus Micrarchaeota archaeon]